jgi:demethylmenaquinone methyltransferase/2-methoxy-6-polyprenyl-1,4-benzoquinol methylase
MTLPETKLADKPAPGPAPHTVLGEYYEDEKDRRRFLDEIFDASAPHYDWIIGLMSFGSGAWYRRQVLRTAGLAPGMRHLDVAVGTGAIARHSHEIVSRKPGGGVIGVDPSMGMLKETRKKVPIPLVRGVAETLPLADTSFDFLTMGYALRHVPDLNRTMAEYFRVLRPGSRLLILEFARPRTKAGYALGRFFLYRIVPFFSRLRSGSEQAHRLMKYCWDTVENCVDPEVIQAAMRSAGFVDIRFEQQYGVLSEYHARKP